MRVLVTGATGYVGGHVSARLLQEGHQVVALSRGGAGPTDAGAALEHVQGDVTTGEGLAKAMRGVDAVVHLVGVIRERGANTFERVHVDGTRHVLQAAGAEGVVRFVHMSAVGADSSAASRYQSTKGRAEALVQGSGLDYTILRPSLIFGAGDEFFGGTLKQLVTLPPVVPVVGTGEYPFRPVYAGDVATAFPRALVTPRATRRTLELTGPTEYTLREMLILVRNMLRPGKPLVNVPLWLMRLGVKLFRLLPNPPITRDQYLMLLAGNTGDPRPAQELLGLELESLPDHLAEVLGAE